MNILIVDDEAVMVDSVRIGLETKGYRVVTALNGRQAMDKISQGDEEIDLVVTDYVMPQMNGLELLEAIRKDHPTLPVIIMTAYAETSMVITALKNRCDSFIEKPFRLEQLVAEIEKINFHLLQNTNSSDVGKLLPKLAHQINNPLSAIAGLSTLITMSHGDKDKVQHYADKILLAVDEISRINKDIMNAGRTEESKIKPVDLDALIDNCLKTFHGLFVFKDIEVEKKSSVQGLKIQGDEYNLDQAFKNLILNAIDAMDGRLVKKLAVTIRLLPESSSVEIAIEDTGCGIREELLGRIFEPYVTGKPKGNGLGLEIVKKVIEKHGGKILVESHAGIGSRFSVLLPTSEMAESRSAAFSG